MSMEDLKKIEAICKQLTSFTAQLNRTEKAPTMIQLRRTSRSKHQRNFGQDQQQLQSQDSSMFGMVTNLFSKLTLPFQNNTFNNLPVQEKVKKLVKDLEMLCLAWLEEWRQVAHITGITEFSRPPSSPHSRHLDEEERKWDMAPFESLTALYLRICDLLFQYQCYLYFLDPILTRVLPLICEFFQAFSLRTTCQHWFYIPTVRLSNTIKYPSESNSASVKFIRHPLDERFDNRDLHTLGRLNKKAMALMQKFNSAYSKSNYKPDEKCFAAELTATYPLVAKSMAMGAPAPPSPLTPRTPLSPDEDRVLLNDPNNDGYLAIFGDGWCVGAVVDGSGAGYHAHLSANILLATLYDMIFTNGDEQQDDKDADLNFTKYCLQQIPWKTSHDCMNFLEKVCREAHKTMVEVEECGATTCILYTITEMSQDDFIFYNSNSKSFKEKFSNSGGIAYVLNYVISGDAEGFVYCSQSKQWHSLHDAPHLHETIRINTSYTPGGLGKHHGSRDKLHGAYLWPDYIEMKGPNVNNYDRSLWVDFHATTNNIHFGQYFMHENDFLIAASDGLGDTLDPIQVFPLPRLILGLENFESWQQFGVEFHNSKLAMREMKELALNYILSSAMMPYGSDEGKKQDEYDKNPSAHQILKTCVNHSMDVTKEDRNLYYNQDFLEADRQKKQQTVQQSIMKWIEENWPKRQSISLTRPFALPNLFVPFAKIDHLGIQVVSPRACKQAKIQS